MTVIKSKTYQKTSFNAFYYILKLFVILIGFLFGVVLALTLFYPIVLSFPHSFIVIFFESYVVILFAIIFANIFSKCFDNYIGYKPLFFNFNFKDIANQNIFLISFYALGLVMFWFFIMSFF